MRPKPCLLPSFHSPRQISSILYLSMMSRLFFMLSVKKVLMFLTGWKGLMLSPVKYTPSPLNSPRVKKPSQQILLEEYTPYPSQKPSLNSPEQLTVLPHPSYLSSLKLPSQTVPVVLNSTPYPFFFALEYSPSKSRLLCWSYTVVYPSIECYETLSALTKKLPILASLSLLASPILTY